MHSRFRSPVRAPGAVHPPSRGPERIGRNPVLFSVRPALGLEGFCCRPGVAGSSPFGFPLGCAGPASCRWPGSAPLRRLGRAPRDAVAVQAPAAGLAGRAGSSGISGALEPGKPPKMERPGPPDEPAGVPAVVEHSLQNWRERFLPLASSMPITPLRPRYRGHQSR